MHSSRMRTVRCSRRLLGGVCPGRGSAQGVSAQGVCLGGVSAQGGCVFPRGVCPEGCRPPPSRGQNENIAGNITFLQLHFWNVTRTNPGSTTRISIQSITALKPLLAFLGIIFIISGWTSLSDVLLWFKVMG